MSLATSPLLIPAGYRQAGARPFFAGPEHFKGTSTPLALSPPTWGNLQVFPFSANCSHQRINNTTFLPTPFYTLKRISLSPDSPSRAESILSSASSCYFPSPLKTFILSNSFHCNTYSLFLTILDPSHPTRSQDTMGYFKALLASSHTPSK